MGQGSARPCGDCVVNVVKLDLFFPGRDARAQWADDGKDGARHGDQEGDR